MVYFIHISKASCFICTSNLYPLIFCYHMIWVLKYPIALVFTRHATYSVSLYSFSLSITMVNYQINMANYQITGFFRSFETPSPLSDMNLLMLVKRVSRSHSLSTVWRIYGLSFDHQKLLMVWLAFTVLYALFIKFEKKEAAAARMMVFDIFGVWSCFVSSNYQRAISVNPPVGNIFLSLVKENFENNNSIVSGESKRKTTANSRGKRPLAALSSKTAETPKPKRGRPPTGSSKNE